MKLEKDDFGIWDNDDEELSIIKKGYKSREISDYILSLQDDLDRLLIKHDEVREELGNMKYVAIVLKKENTELKEELESNA
mgnify:CR=1 FL=1